MRKLLRKIDICCLHTLLVQYPTIHPKGGWVCAQIFRQLCGGPLGLHRGRMSEGPSQSSFICSAFAECVCQGTINNRINILYFLDSLCEASLLAKSHPDAAEILRSGPGTTSFYVDYVARDLGKIIELVVPEGRQGLPNLLSTTQVGLASHGSPSAARN